MLRTAFGNIHRDPDWWKKIGIGGVLMLTLLGYPLAVGLVTESLDNSRKGYPTPLPPWYDWSTRYLIGIFSLLIDFVFFVLPILIIGLLMVCVSLGFVVAGSFNERGSSIVLSIIGAFGGLVLLALFLGSVAPVARLVYVDEGRIEDALSIIPLRRAFGLAERRSFWQARLASLVAYLPAILFGALLALVARVNFAAQVAVLLLLAWLTLCALLYAYLVVMQLYVAAERAAAYATRHPPAPR